MKKYIKSIAWLLVLYGGLFIFLSSTDPSKLSVGWLIVPFVWMFGAFYYTVRLVMRLFALTPSKNPKKSRLTAVFIAAVPTLLLLLDSIDQLTLKDVLLIVALGTGALFYANRLNLTRSSF
jgi:hypothetical protein